MNIEHLPRTPKGIREKALREGWEARRVSARGGRDGTRVEFLLPQDVMLAVSYTGGAHVARESHAEYQSEMRACDALLMMHRLVQQAGFDCPAEWRMMLLEQLVSGDITEAGALDVLKRAMRPSPSVLRRSRSSACITGSI